MATSRPPSPGSDSDLARQVDEASRAVDLAYEDPAGTRFGRAVNQVAEAAGVAVLAAIVAIVFFNAVGRYAFQFTFIWGDEVVLSLLPWLGMLGMFVSIRRRQIIRIDFFVASRSPTTARLLEIMGSLLAAVAFVYLATVSLQYLQFFGGDRTIYLKIQKGWFMAAMVAGPALAAAAYVVMMVDTWRRRSRSVVR